AVTVALVPRAGRATHVARGADANWPLVLGPPARVIIECTPALDRGRRRRHPLGRRRRRRQQIVDRSLRCLLSHRRLLGLLVSGRRFLSRGRWRRESVVPERHILGPVLPRLRWRRRRKTAVPAFVLQLRQGGLLRLAVPPRCAARLGRSGAIEPEACQRIVREVATTARRWCRGGVMPRRRRCGGGRTALRRGPGGGRAPSWRGGPGARRLRDRLWRFPRRGRGRRHRRFLVLDGPV